MNTVRAEPLVTILVPTYGRAHYVCTAVRSALKQTYGRLEVLVLDDASPDDTETAIKVLLEDRRVHYIRHPHNLGIVNNWRFGIAAATGEFFCLLHDDDTFATGFVEALVAPLVEDASLALAFCDHAMIDADGQVLPHAEVADHFRRHQLASGSLPREAFERAVLVDHSIPIGATLFRRSAVDSNFIDERAKGAIDYWLLYHILKTGFGASYVNQRLMNYRAHSGGMSASSALYMAAGHLFRCDAVLNDPQFVAWRPRIADERWRTLTARGINLTQAGRASEARQSLWTVLREKPSLRAAVAFLLACGGPFGRWLTVQLRA